MWDHSGDRERREQHDERIDRGPVARRLDHEEDDAQVHQQRHRPKPGRCRTSAGGETARRGPALARAATAPATASSAKTQKHTTPAIAEPRVTLAVEAVWIDQSSPPR